MLQRIRTIEGYELLPISEAAEMCQVTVRTIYNWIEDGRLAIRANIANKVKLVDKAEVLTAADSYQTTKPRGKKQKVKGKAA